MDADALVLFAHRFTSEPFSRDEALALLGEIKEETTAALILAPRPAWQARRIILESAAAKTGNKMVAGVIFEFDRVQNIQLPELIRRWGAWKKKPRLKPDQPIPIQFQVETPKWLGHVLLDCQELPKGNTAKVSRVIFRRAERD